MSPALGDSSQAPMMNAFVAASTQSLLTPQVTLSGWMFPWSSRLQVQVQLELEPSQGAAAPRARRRRRSGAPRTTPRGGARGARAEARASWYSVRATMARRSEDSLNAVVGLFVIVVTITTVVLIFVIGVQPPNEWALYITLGFVVVTAVVWLAIENWRFKGPPIGAEVAARQAEIAAAEAAVGEAG